MAAYTGKVVIVTGASSGIGRALALALADRGQIVTVASLADLTGVPTRAGYAASKHAVFGFFDSLRNRAARRGGLGTVLEAARSRSDRPDRAPRRGTRALGALPAEPQR
jgi:NAD(P)-dependent dehydrogenase (short-subunit alcohol dehydrogenase family)